MKNKKFLAVSGASLAIVLTVYIVFASVKKFKHPVNPAFRQYVTAYTAGIVSSESPVRVRFAADMLQPEQLNKPVSKDLFSFSPEIDGTVVWTDNRTLEFRPSKPMRSGQDYFVTFQLGKIMKVPDKLREFDFNFQVIPQDFEVNVSGLQPMDKRQFDRQILVGDITTADVANAGEVEKVLAATQNGKRLPIRWGHRDGRMVHVFYVDSVMRTADSGSVILAWNGSPIHVALTGQQKINVPALGYFFLTGSSVVTDEKGEQYISLEFSDPLLETQNLNGLVSLNNSTDLKFTIEDNTLRVYPAAHFLGNIELVVNPAVRNTLGKQLANEIRTSIYFEELKPAVRLTGKGVILPGGAGLLFPFEAVNLNAVDVRVVKIYENNVEQFLQVNSLDGESELARVGRIVLKKTVPLSTIKQTDFSKWNQFALNLDDLVKLDPGSIYRVSISFRKKYSLYDCAGADTGKANPAENDNDMQDNWDEAQNDASGWDYIDDYVQNSGEEDEDGGNYRYQDRNNPCSGSYYRGNRFVSRNVVASNLGLIAKGGTDGSMFFAVTSLRTTQPLPDVTLEAYNMQRQLIQRMQTDEQGMAKVNLDNKPFLLIAKNGKERGYLKLDDGSSLSLSTFDVSGEKVQKGIKGFIYGERGVWRPGDSLFLTFILEDKQKALPENYPVVFELYNPLGQMVKRMVRSQSLNNFYSFHTSTDEEAPTGSWEARVKVGNAVFSKTLRIETVMPNRLKIKFDFPAKVLTKDNPQTAKMQSQWLTGANAGKLKANVEVSLSAGHTTFPKYNEFVFDDPTRKFSADKQMLFDTTLDATGRANVKADIKVEDAAPGILQANFTVRVFEPGGNFSVDRFSMPYSPYSVYTGIRLPKGDKARGMLRTDTNHIVQIVSVDANGNPVQGKRQVVIEFYQIQWRWWWDKSDDNLASYNSAGYNYVRKRDTITTVNGVGEWTLRLAYPNWGRFLIRATDVQSGHCAGKAFYMDWPGWAGHAQNEQTSATMLSFSANKDVYITGEQVALTIPSSNKGRALVSIENGTRVLNSYWVECKAGETHFKFPVTEEMAPNIYVSVTLLQPHAQTVNDLPIRMYGIIPLSVENPHTHLTPVIKMKDELRPLDKVNVTISEANQQEMTYTIAVVDEGLLDLTRFSTPDPWSAFYAREALGVKTWDMFDFVMGAYGARMERILAIGGDEGINKPKDGHRANRFKPVVMFMGPYHINKGESQTHSFQMPEYVGSVRTMVIAGSNGAYGFAEKTTPVRKPLMVLATLPRVLGPDESVDLPITVFAMDKKVKDVEVEIQANDRLEVAGAKTRTIKFTETGDEVVNFKLKVKPELGLASVKVVAKSGDEKAATSIELDVRNANPPVTEETDTVLAAGESWNNVCKPVGMSGTNKVMVEVSDVPPLNLGQRLNYLIHYPYGCVEQTTSGVFPQLYLTDLMDMPAVKKEEVEYNIRAGINRLKLFQTSSGGMAYWPGEREEDEWATNYAGHFMAAAEQKGYAMPAGFIEQWKKFQHARASTWNAYRDNDYFTQAYRLYVLALAKSPDLACMNRLRETSNLPVMAKWDLAAAYALVGQLEVANRLVEGLPITIGQYTEEGGTYGSEKRDEAVVLQTLALLGKTDQGMLLLKKLSEMLCAQTYMSTQTTAYSLMAAAQFLGKTGLKAPMNFTYQVNGGLPQIISTQSAIRQVPVPVKGAEDENIVIRNTGKNMMYVRIIREGTPKSGEITSSEKNLEMEVAYYATDGSPIDVTQLRQGSDFYMEVKVTNPSYKGIYQQMALKQIFPSGWEILNTRLDQTDNSTKVSQARYQDIRDDRVYTFFDLKPHETKTFRTYLNASFLGTFYLPAIVSEEMYDGAIGARKAGKWVTVGPQGASTKETSLK